MGARRRAAGRVLRGAGAGAGILLLVLVVVKVRDVTGRAAGPEREGNGCAQSELQVVRDAHLGDLSAVRAAIGAGLDPDQRDQAGNTPLACAGPRGHVRVVQLLLDAGAAPGTEARDGDTVAADAVRFCQQEVLDALLAAGASPASRAASGERLIDLAIDQGHLGMAELLLDRGVDPAGWASEEILRLTTVESTSPCPDPTGAGRSEVLQLLLARGAPSGQVLAEAVERQARHAVGAALDAGADPDGRTDSWVSLSLFGLAQTRRTPAATSTTASDRQGPTVPLLMVTAAHGDLRSTELLLAAGADPGATDGQGWTALHAGAAEGHVAVLAALLDAGAPARPGTAPLLPSQVARARHHPEAADLLAAAEAAG